MKFKELIIKNKDNWDAIEEELQDHFNFSKMFSKRIVAWENMFISLQTMDAIDIDISIWAFDYEQSVRADPPYGTHYIGELYFNSWEEWLGFNVGEYTFNRLSEIEFIALCLWEMPLYDIPIGHPRATKICSSQIYCDLIHLEHNNYITNSEYILLKEYDRHFDLPDVYTVCDEWMEWYNDRSEAIKKLITEVELEDSKNTWQIQLSF
ncbi:MAG: hypothetical protein LBO69_05190 [Ignavibacteria bacterium]|jgi:hypothetical protein|nr:hypothetical protein [Ignavibacteria bacterium]